MRVNTTRPTKGGETPWHGCIGEEVSQTSGRAVLFKLVMQDAGGRRASLSCFYLEGINLHVGLFSWIPTTHGLFATEGGI